MLRASSISPGVPEAPWVTAFLRQAGDVSASMCLLV